MKLKILMLLIILILSSLQIIKNLLCKFKLLSEEHEELKLKIENINDTNHASNSCFDKPNPCNEKCYEDVIVESCDDLIVKENDELK